MTTEFGMVNTFRAKGPLLVFGGPYSNLEAMSALLDEAASRGIRPDHMICTGDVVAYAADAANAVALVRKSTPNVVMGNCEESLAVGLADCGCGFPAGSACERLSAAWFTHAARQIGPEARRWMARLPRRIDVEIGEYRLAAIHGGIKSINQFIFASSAASTKAKELDLAGVDGIIAGHCGLPFSQSVNGRLWHNSGAIGMPANDGTPRVWFSILTAEASGLRIEHCSLDYAFEAAAEKMRQAGLPDDYANALESGLWPSCDVLPLREIRARGVRIEEASIIWRRPPAIDRPGRRSSNIVAEQLWPNADLDNTPKLSSGKFNHSDVTEAGEPRATVPLRRLQTVWFNTGTLCNITCRNCYIESSPKNDRLVYLSRGDVASYLDEIERDNLGTEEIGFTGGEPFMNPDFLDMLEDCLSRGFRVLALTNAMRPMQRAKARLVDLNQRFGSKLTIRVSLDHFNLERHEDERGPRTFKPTLDGLIWLAHSNIKVSVAGRTMWGEDISAERGGYAQLFVKHEIPINANDPAELVLFPEMDPKADVPEITTSCWGILDKSPDDVMCASSRMIVKRKGSSSPAVLACTLIPYDDRFELGKTLADAARPVSLNHPHCAKFCVLGGASCSAGSAHQN